MKSPFAIFRKHQKVLMVVLTGLAMFAFVVMDSLNREHSELIVPVLLALGAAAVFGFLGRRSGEGIKYGVVGAAVGALAGLFLLWNAPGPKPPVETQVGNLSQEELQNLIVRRHTANNFLRAAFERVAPPVGNNAWMAQMLGQQAERMMFRYVSEDDTEDVVFGFLLDKEADDMGIVVTQEAVNDYINRMARFGTRKLTADDFAKIIKAMGVSNFEVYRAIAGELRPKLAMEMLTPALLSSPTPEQYWEDYRKLHMTETLDVAAVPIADFVAEAPQPAADEVVAYFDRWKDIPAPGPGALGLRQPRRVRIEYLQADFAEVEKEVALQPITDAEVKKYYDDHREDYRNRPAGEGFPSLEKQQPLPPGPALPNFDIMKGISGEKEALPKTGNAPASPAPGGKGPADSKAAPGKKEPPASQSSKKAAQPQQEGKTGGKSGASNDRKAWGAGGRGDPLAETAWEGPLEFIAYQPQATAPHITGSSRATGGSSATGPRGATGGLPATSGATGGLPATPGATGGLPATPGATGGLPATPVATGGLPATPVATGGLPATPGATGGLPASAIAFAATEPPPPAMPEPPGVPSKNQTGKPGAPGKPGPAASQGVEGQPEFKPLDETLKRDIRALILRSRTHEAMKARIRKAIDFLSSLRDQLISADLDSPAKTTPEQRRKLLSEYASKNKLEYGITPPMSYQELQDSAEKFPIAAAAEPMDDAFAQRAPVSVLQTVFTSPPEQLFQPGEADDRVAHRFAYWKVEDIADHVPKLDDPGVRDAAIRGWKIEKFALKKAKERADELAELVRKSKQSMSEALAGQTVTKKEKGPAVVVVPTPPFSWFTVQSAAPQGLESDSRPRLSDISGVKEIDEAFMKTVFDEMRVGDVRVIPNCVQTQYVGPVVEYVVKLKTRHPADQAEMEGFRARYLGEIKNQFGSRSFLGGPSTYEYLNMPAQQQLVQNWAQRLQVKYGLRRNLDEERRPQRQRRRAGF